MLRVPRRHEILGSIAASAFLWSACAGPQQKQTRFPIDERWTVHLEGAATFSSLEGDVGVGLADNTTRVVNIGDVLRQFESGAMASAEVHRMVGDYGWGVMLEYEQTDFGTDQPSSTLLAGSVNQRILQGYFNYRQIVGRYYVFDTFLGARGWDVEQSVTSTAPATSTRREDWVDPVIGMKLTTHLTDDFHFLTRGDVGGVLFGSAFTWSLSAGIRAQVFDFLGVEVQYRALGVDYSENENTSAYFKYETVTHGPFVAMTLDF